MSPSIPSIAESERPSKKSSTNKDRRVRFEEPESQEATPKSTPKREDLFSIEDEESDEGESGTNQTGRSEELGSDVWKQDDDPLGGSNQKR